MRPTVLLLLFLSLFFLSTSGLSQKGKYYAGKTECKEDSCWKVLDANGELIMETESRPRMVRGWKWIYVETDKGVQVYDSTGAKLPLEGIQDIFKPHTPSELRPMMKDSLWGFYGPEGNRYIEHRYLKTSLMLDSLAKVKKGGKVFVIDASGERYDLSILEDKESLLYRFSKIYTVVVSKETRFLDNGRYEIFEKEGLKGLKDHETGELLVPAEFDSFKAPSENRIIAEKDGNFGLIDRKGSTIIPFQYGELEELNR